MKKRQFEGFSLLELMVAIVIITIGLSTSIPTYIRNMRQGEVDRYTQQIEAGFFALRAKLGKQKTSCTLRFDHSGLSNFVPPADLVEMGKHPERLECCNSDIRAAGEPSGCTYGPQIGTLLASSITDSQQKSKLERDRSLRLLGREGNTESKMVEVSVNSATYELTPPGTSTMSDNLIFLIRSTKTDEQRLRTRCLQISGTGTVLSASWNYVTSSCEQ
ncbi:type II secretion system protein [Synechococcus sp. Cu2B8-bc1011]|uniref:type II secretion system protein n=1 Tax=Synechococcus sp. Cu2B8-bc1011 TaxID=3093725 RepID=UPI0039AFDF0E